MATAVYGPSHAKWLLSRLDKEHPISAAVLEDEPFMVCRTCGVRLSENGTRHSIEEIKALREAAEPSWP